MKISVIVNCDTRIAKDSAEQMFDGCRDSDFLTDGILNKRLFFEDFDVEFIVYVDEHFPLTNFEIRRLKDIAHTVVVRSHTDELNFNDWNYWRALAMATGDIVCHMDQDTACFTSGKQYVEELLSHLDNHKFVSYPSHWTPYPVYDESFGGQFWASTRFFLCKRESLKLDELAECIKDPEWMYQKYGDSPRRLNWTEHFLTKINGGSVFYPPIETHRGLIFSWGNYKAGTLAALNTASYEEVKQWAIHRGGIHYPCDIKCF
jgi:hypothetical protein